MKFSIIFLLIVLVAFFACSGPGNDNNKLRNRIDSLEQQPANSYKPGLGEFMTEIQLHHAKLWFAGKNQNWNLADFEINEIIESLDGIKKYCTDRPEIKAIGMINPSIDSMVNAIRQKDTMGFKSSYTLLTNTCNNCHQATNHAFNVIKIPDNPPFSNQDFRVHQ